MEPRIATLLGHNPVERPAADALPWYTTASHPSLHPFEPTTANEHAHTRANSASTAASLLDRPERRRQHSPTQETAPKRQKPSAPIASVLNTVTPFSGRLSDLLLDPSQQQQQQQQYQQQPSPPKRKRNDDAADVPPSNALENPVFTLPIPRQQPKKSTKRPRIPPLLQGLHQVPPQAQSRLFPPITSESSAFRRDRGEGAALRTTSGTERLEDQSVDSQPNVAPVDPAAAPQQDLQPKAPAKAASAPTSDKENPTLSAPTVTKEFKKRNKWSEQETKDLLVGVSRFGIGSWKKILQCPDFKFNQRTAVDLKDRFRTCCPGEGLKARKSRRKGEAYDDSSQATIISSTTTSMSSNPESVVLETPDTLESLRRNRADTHRKGPAELREMGIHGSFTRSRRRERRPFTEQDDENLLRGFEKYSSSWHLMRDDKALGFSTRQPTDLRDRFRIRYPEKFAKAGYKLKPKDEAMLKKKEKGEDQGDDTTQIPSNTQRSPRSIRVKSTASSASFSSLTSTATSNSSLMPLALRGSFLTSFTGPLDDYGDRDSEADADHDSEADGDGPIVLNRNILAWADANADANPSQTAAAFPTSLQSMGAFACDEPLNILNAGDTTHINPAVTLNMPMTLLNSSVLSSTSQQSSSHTATSSRLHGPYHHANTATASTSAAAKHANDSMLRTPNLPTIVFPHVPASSARSAVHNLPPPADLLSGVVTDARPDGQMVPFIFDESLGHANFGTVYTSGATLAPMSSMPGREMLTLERGLLQDPGEGD